jgi:hypothetical protein
MLAKTENLAPGQGGFELNWSDAGQGIGKIECGNLPSAQRSACLAQLDDGDTAGPNLRYGDRPHFKNPSTAAYFDLQQQSLFRLVQAIDGGGSSAQYAGSQAPAQGGSVMLNAGAGWVQRRPFFMWFGPNLPHEPPHPDRILEDLYDPSPSDGETPYHQEEFYHYARVSWLDMMTGGLIYHLKRACSCAPGGGIRSLYDNTAIVFLSDHGFLPWQSKRTPSEDSQRTPLIINAPEYRVTTPIERVFADEIPNAIDLLPTIIEYSQAPVAGQNRRWFPGWAGGNADLQEDYPHDRPLRTLIAARHNSAVPTYRRNLFFGEQSTENARGNNQPASGMPRYVVTRPGLLGVCQLAYVGAQAPNHLHPCLSNADCILPGQNLGQCVCPPISGAWCSGITGDTKWKRCVNRPWLRCAADLDCRSMFGSAELDCLNGTCTTQTGAYGGSYKDFAGKACTRGDQCMPPGVCQPFVLKAVVDDLTGQPPSNRIQRIYDLGWSPKDEPYPVSNSAIELLTRLGDAYLGLPTDSNSLKVRLGKCIDTFANQADRNVSGVMDNWKETALCGLPLGNWWQPATPGLLWWDAP